VRTPTPVPASRSAATVETPRARKPAVPRQVRRPSSTAKVAMEEAVAIPHASKAVACQSTQTDSPEHRVTRSLQRPLAEELWDVATWAGSDSSVHTIQTSPVKATSFKEATNGKVRVGIEVATDEIFSNVSKVERQESVQETIDIGLPVTAANSLEGASLDAVDVRNWLCPAESSSIKKESAPGAHTVIYMPESTIPAEQQSSAAASRQQSTACSSPDVGKGALTPHSAIINITVLAGTPTHPQNPSTTVISSGAHRDASRASSSSSVVRHPSVEDGPSLITVKTGPAKIGPAQGSAVAEVTMRSGSPIRSGSPEPLRSSQGPSRRSLPPQPQHAASLGHSNSSGLQMSLNTAAIPVRRASSPHGSSLSVNVESSTGASVVQDRLPPHVLAAHAAAASRAAHTLARPGEHGVASGALTPRGPKLGTAGLFTNVRNATPQIVRAPSTASLSWVPPSTSHTPHIFRTSHATGSASTGSASTVVTPRAPNSTSNVRASSLGGSTSLSRPSSVAMVSQQSYIMASGQPSVISSGSQPRASSVSAPPSVGSRTPSVAAPPALGIRPQARATSATAPTALSNGSIVRNSSVVALAQ
jgi:hypothetical protein